MYKPAQSICCFNVYDIRTEHSDYPGKPITKLSALLRCPLSTVETPKTFP